MIKDKWATIANPMRVVYDLGHGYEELRDNPGPGYQARAIEFADAAQVHALQEELDELREEVKNCIAGIRSRISSLVFAAPELQKLHIELIEGLCAELLEKTNDQG